MRTVIGGLARPVPPVPEKRSLIILSAPTAGFQNRRGDRLARGYAGRRRRNRRLDEEQLTYRTQNRKKPPFPDRLSLIPAGPINTEALRDAIYRYADAVIQKAGSRYRALTDF